MANTLLTGSAIEVERGLSVPLGLVPGWSAVHKFGRTDNADNATPTDLWNGADILPQPVWLPPTVAETFNVTSTLAADDGSPAGTGLRTLRIFGLQTWSSPETSEDIVMNGVTPVVTANSYVMINLVQGLTFGSGGTNAGSIRITGTTDSRVVITFLPGTGQSQAAVYGFPSGYTFLLTYLTSTVRRGSDAPTDVSLLVRKDADQSDTNFVVSGNFNTTRNNSSERAYFPAFPVAGPGIVKLQATATANDTAVAGGFDGFLVKDPP